MKIAVFIGGMMYEAQSRLVEGIIKYAGESDDNIYIFTCLGSIYKRSKYAGGEFQIYSLPDLTQYDGVIMVKGTIWNRQVVSEIIQRITDLNIPAVSIEDSIPGKSEFYSDSREVMHELVSHLIEVHGVKKICFLSGPKHNKASAERLEGVLDAVREHGLTLDDDSIHTGDYMADSGRRLVKHLMESGKDLPEAIVCANDFMALGVYMELCKYGVQVGKDVLLTGFDHTSDTSNLMPAITTVESSQREIGYEACKSLAENRVVENRKFKAKCCYEGSCGCPEHRNRNFSEELLLNAQRKRDRDTMVEISRSMASNMNECDNLQDFCECLKTYIEALKADFVYLCLCVEEEAEDKAGYEYDYKIRESYSERVYIPLAYEKGNFTEYPSFASNELLPKSVLEKIGSGVCIVVPIYFRNNCLGYLVTCGSSMPYKNTEFYNWVTYISSALENIRKQEELKRLVNKLSSVWMLDSLTQVYNRAGFFYFADDVIEECKRKDIPIGILFVDINKLKRVNDGYGHQEGDFYIKSVAGYMEDLKSKEQLLMRYGGDEFVVLGKLIKGNEFDSLTEKLNLKLEECRKQNGKPYGMSVSMGFQSVVITDDFKIDRCMEQADMEMYKMKCKSSEVSR